MPAAALSPDRRILSFGDLDGWPGEGLDDALAVFCSQRSRLTEPAWQPLFDAADAAADARVFFESIFVPVVMAPGSVPKITGYYEPELEGARARSDVFPTPIHRAPPDLSADTPWLTRREIEENGVLDDPSLVLAWVANPAERFFLQVQGSGRIRFADGSMMRVGYAAKNGHPYRSIGQHLIDSGTLPAQGLTAQAIKDWLVAHPDRGRRVMWHNPSYVFFREIDTVSPKDGPIGSLGLPVTPMTSVAVDPDFIPLGLPVWIAPHDPSCPKALMVAQDTGSAIKGGQRIDVFAGTGAAAGDLAGALNASGQVAVLVPRRWLG